jgi:hypothetical protein
VVREVAAVLPVRLYAASPLGDCIPPVVGPTEAVVTVSYFGADPVAMPDIRGAWIVDATHDPLAPWLEHTDADFIFASLRKTLPLPDGGIVWSPCGWAVPAADPAGQRHVEAASTMLAAMALKADHLAGGAMGKDIYLDRFRLAEAGFAGSTPGAACAYTRQVLVTFPVRRWREQRLANLAAFRAALPGGSRRPPSATLCGPASSPTASTPPSCGIWTGSTRRWST